jgi:hypothetical protein
MQNVPLGASKGRAMQIDDGMIEINRTGNVVGASVVFYHNEKEHECPIPDEHKQTRMDGKPMTGWVQYAETESEATKKLKSTIPEQCVKEFYNRHA